MVKTEEPYREDMSRGRGRVLSNTEEPTEAGEREKAK
jgi:hypothetical protein